MPLPVHPNSTKQLSNGTAEVKAIIAIAAGKGGVGKSTVTANLALALAEQGLSVGIMDTDLYGPSIRQMLPETRLPEWDQGAIRPALSFGIKLISIAYFQREGEMTAVRAPMANGIITQFVHQVQWGRLDYLLVDFPPGTGDIPMTLCQRLAFDGALMVTTPQEVALIDLRKAIALFDALQVPILGIVENMSYYLEANSSPLQPLYLFGKGGGERLASQAGVPLLAEIPIDPEISFRADRGFSLFAEEEGKLPSSAICFRHLAEQLMDHYTLLSTHQEKPLTLDRPWREMSATQRPL